MQDLPRRLAEIVTLARESGRVTVDELSQRFAVSPQTIRRDLNELCDRGVLNRMHGGAVIASGIENLAYDARRLLAREAKARIGAAAAALIPNDSSLFINIGTTTEEVARALARHHGLLVITNNLHVAAELYRHQAIEVILAGGVVRRSDGGIIGATAVEMIHHFRVDTAVIGTSAIEHDGSLLDFDLREVRVSRAIIENARRVVLVADSGKFGRAAPVRIAHIREVDTLVTDRLPDPALAELCRAEGVEVVETGGGEEL
ncbi:DeoR/GlpR family DNA-binding transcription regulator [Roseomonas sp. NAR14]|uniref:DeoR/GlpR family DNA-binding transcription regulator n=1 Tax=Roseomonas acroporae TaxID=2937791 RepID=A0A9X1YF49_9PROT|nr:DeoR/GlpR family DNA-binding transcription regulator [Roseomonas acroporae]MCK8787517.1 DeoR/GlpR family DNA-binding transcription regulator [Roseomonas acroporae]